MSKRTLIRNGQFVTLGERNDVVSGYMIVAGDRIEAIEEGEAPESHGCDEVVNGAGKLYAPGLVNTHCHAAMSLLRGYGDDLALKVWLQEKMWPNEEKFTAEDVRRGTLLTIVEMVKSGTTAFVDMYDHMNEVAQAVEQSGMRAVLTRGMIGYCPPDVQAAKLAEAKQFVKDWQGAAGGRITTMMSPHAPYTCPPDFIERVVAAAHELNVPIHTHMSETALEVSENEQQYGVRPVAHLERLGVFSRPCLIAHGVHLNDEEIDTLHRYDVRVSHNPGSNLKLASGIARVPELLKAGVLVSLGTDSSASNNNVDMFEEMRLAALIHKGASGDPLAVPAIEAFRMATEIGARSIWLEQVGALRPGYKADFIAVDIDQPHWFPRSNLLSHFVYAASSHDVTDVWIDGKAIVRNKECLTLDEERVRKEAQLSFERLVG